MTVSDAELAAIDSIAWGMILLFGLAAALLLNGVEAPYGRYATNASRYRLHDDCLMA